MGHREMSSAASAFLVKQIHGVENVFVDIDRENRYVEGCNEVFWKLYEKYKQRKPEIKLKLIVWGILNKAITQRFPNGRLLLKGSTVNNLGTKSSDLDLCLAVRDPKTGDYDENFALEYLAKAERALKKCVSVYSVDFIDARIPILKVEMAFPYNHFAVDITCNCLVGVFNSHLLCYYALLDERFPALAIIVKTHAKERGIIDPRIGKLNSYAIILMIIHFLQCGVDPPILPNLMKLFPDMFDGEGDPRDLKYSKSLAIPEIPKNERTLVELAYGFYNYYAQFNYDSERISIYDARTYNRVKESHREQQYAFILEEPYTKLNVAMNLRKGRVEDLRDEFAVTRDIILKDLLGDIPTELMDESDRKDREWFEK